MHQLLIDWLKRIHLTADTALATKRWKLAETLAEKISRKELLQLMRAFLFSPAPPELIQTLTEQFLKIDPEFPASKNVEDVRLMAGIVMVVAFSQRTLDADAFALGIKAAAFPQQRCKPAQTDIIGEAMKYLEAKAEAARPSDFDDRGTVAKKLEAFGEAINDDEARKTAQDELAKTLHENYGQKLQRLAEETGLLWWLLGGYSSALNLKTEEIDNVAYALIAATEVAERTQLLPPPPSIYAILGRAIAPCKATKNHFTIKEFVSAANAAWRNKLATAHPAADCADFVPFMTALVKTEEAGGTSTLAKVLPKSCPGVAANSSLTPSEAAGQLYNELMFLKALATLD
jgi:hypothetical protein